MNGWTFVYLMLVLKIPIVALLWLVWWAVHQTPDEEAGGDGGEGRDVPPRIPRGPASRVSRRGPHREPRPPAPPRTRPAGALAHHGEREPEAGGER